MRSRSLPAAFARLARAAPDVARLRIFQEGFVTGEVLAHECGQRLVQYLERPKQQAFDFFAVIAEGIRRIVKLRQPRLHRFKIRLGGDLFDRIGRRAVGARATVQGSGEDESFKWNKRQIRLISHAYRLSRCALPFYSIFMIIAIIMNFFFAGTLMARCDGA